MTPTEYFSSKNKNVKIYGKQENAANSRIEYGLSDSRGGSSLFLRICRKTMTLLPLYTDMYSGKIQMHRPSRR